MRTLLLPLVVAAIVGLASSCPPRCICNDVMMRCVELGLTSIPSGIPRFVEKIELQKNNITHIGREDFAELKRLRILYLADNQISSIERNAFNDNTHLEILRMSNNELTILPEMLLSRLRNLQRLDLSHNKLGIIQRKTLRGPMALRTLQLDNNEITCLHETSLRAVRSVEFLTLNDNRLTTLSPYSFEHLSKLRTFRLSNNPLNCDCHLAWIADWFHSRPSAGLFTQCAEPAHLRRTEIRNLDRSEFECNVMAGRQRPTCEISSYCPSACACRDGIVDCRNKGLTALPATLPSDVVEIRLEQNLIRSIPSRAFTAYRKLQRIDLSNNLISEVYKDSFQGLKKLNSLIMYGNKISSLPKGIFTHLTELQLLLLNANKITCLRHDTFDGLVSLKLLSLYDNKIQTISKGTFKSLKAIETLHLAQNPFICDCNLRWLADYLQDNPVETSGARCTAPRKLGNKKISQIKSKKFKCEEGQGYTPPFAGECSLEAECPDQCRCDGTIVDCSRQGLTGVPDNIPPYATELNLAFNDMETLASLEIFKKLTNLKKIDLSNNRLTTIEEGAFNGAFSVLELWINDNELRELKGSMFSGLRNLRTLMVRNNRLSCVNNATFAGLSTLSHLSLYGNEITSIAEGAFDSLTSLNLLNLLSNPLLCNCHMSWLSVWLRTGSFSSGNPRCSQPSFLHGFPVADINPQDFQCSPEEELDPPTCKPKVKCPERCICEGSIIRCIEVGMASIPVDDIPDDVTELYMNSNEIRLIPPSFKKFIRLEKLDLSNNHIATLQDNIFANFTRLSTLLLAYNRIRCLPLKGFTGLRNLRILSLHGNEISTVQHGTFDDLVSLTHAGFGSNPWYCDCNLAWFNEWINKDYLEPGIAQCSGPRAVAGRVLLTTPVSRFVCNGPLSLPIASKCDPCLSSPCLHNGTCRLHPVDYYQCICPSGFKGKHCEMPVNACNLGPCMNGATCTGRDEISYTCTCAPGFTGYDCEKNIDDCAMNPCRGQNATCIDGINSYKCRCLPGWSGDACEVKIEDPCVESPCLNGGECVAQLDSRGDVTYRCECQPGYRGENCSAKFDPCLSHKCENDAQCIVDANPENRAGYRCECRPDTRGQYCEFVIGTTLIQQDDPCLNHDCENGAQCLVEPGSSDFTCRCLPGYTGNKCEMLSGVSFTRNGSYAELQTPIGTQEDLVIKLEVSTKQLNGVFLYSGNTGQHLTLELFAGHVRFSYDGINSAIYSEEIINDEEFHEILLHVRSTGVSLVLDNSRTYEETNKPKPVNVATPVYVGGMPGNILSDARRSWHVRNTTTFIGCMRDLAINDEQVDFFTTTQGDVVNLFAENANTGVHAGCSPGGAASSCDAAMCKFGDCEFVPEQGFVCRCFDGYTGPTCNVVVPALTTCTNHNCEHGTCVPNRDDDTSYTCDCDAGYKGTLCDVRDYCVGVDCGEFGSCLATSSGYMCKCRKGRTGRHCEKRVRKCSGTKTRQFVQITVSRPEDPANPSAPSTMMCKSQRRVSNRVCDGSSCSRLRRRSGRGRNARSNSPSSRSRFTAALEAPSGATCCRPVRQKKKQVELACEDGSTIVEEVTKVQSCGCQPC